MARDVETVIGQSLQNRTVAVGEKNFPKEDKCCYNQIK